MLTRLLELLPLAFVLGTSMAALRHEEMASIQRAALRNSAKIVGWLVVGCAAIQCVLFLVQD